MADKIYSPEEIAKFTAMYAKNIVPLRIILPSLTWVLHDYFVTLEDEVQYVWGQKRSLGKILYLFIRYYTIFLLVFDVVQIHTFAIPGVTSNKVCVAIDPVVRLLGGISLWSVEIVMQIRVYALFNRSKRVAVFNGVLFLVSVAAFLWIMQHNARRRGALIATAVRLPLPGCPVINLSLNWALWVPATGYELVLFGFALYKSARTVRLRSRLQEKTSLTQVLIGDNILYFFGITGFLLLNCLQTVPHSKVPWFSFGPFHAATGIMTTRMLMHLIKVSQMGPSAIITSQTADMAFASRNDPKGTNMSLPNPKSSGRGGTKVSFNSASPTLGRSDILDLERSKGESIPLDIFHVSKDNRF